MATQQRPPNASTGPPDLTRVTTFVVRPMAIMAMIIINLAISLKGSKMSLLIPKKVAKVVIKEARIK